MKRWVIYADFCSVDILTMINFKLSLKHQEIHGVEEMPSSTSRHGRFMKTY